MSASAIALALAAGPKPVEAAEIACTRWVGATDPLDVILKDLPLEPECRWARFTGEIEPGDYEKVRSFFKQHYLTLQSISLRSPGGDVSEALKIGSLWRKYLVSVTTPFRREGAKGGDFFTLDPDDPCEGQTCICASSCALMWFGAVSRFGIVGIHRPKITAPEFISLPADQAAWVYKRTLDAVSRYLEDMEAPRSVLDHMRETSSADISWINDPGESKFENPPSFREWIDASCGSYSDQDARQRYTVGKRGSAERRAKSWELSVKQNDRYICQRKLINEQLRKLPPP